MKLWFEGVVRCVRTANKIVVLVFLFVAALSIGAAAQEATIVGTVMDSSGAVVPNATITITNIATGQSRKMQSNDVAQYVATALPIGNYDIKAQATGFNLADTTGVVLNVGDRLFCTKKY